MSTDLKTDLGGSPLAHGRGLREEAPRGPARGHLINRSAVRAFALELSHKLRRGRFTRVSGAFLDGVEMSLRVMLADRVHRAPGRKTL